MSIEEVDMSPEGYILEDKRLRIHTLKWVVSKDQLHIEAMQGGTNTEPVAHKAVLQLP